MNEMEVGSSTLDYEDIEQFQNEAKESLKKANGSLRKLFKDAINKNGIQGMHDVLKHELNRWKDVKLNIAITGAAGTGKSSLINTLRGIRPSHPLAAKVGVDETTLQPTPYPHPQYDNVVYWDLPGVGTLKFKKDTYVEKTDLDKYDLFIIVGCGRFTENDAWLASEVFKIDRQVYIVRTKIDIDMQNEMSDYAERFQKKVVMEKIRQSTTANMEKLADEMHLKKAVVEKIPIFLISTKLHDVKKYDFEDLQKTMTDEIPDIKKEAMVMALSTLTLSAIDEKMKVIKERFQKMWGAITVALCIPGINILSLFFVEGILDNEMNMYRQQLGIDDESIIQRNIDVNNLDLQMTPTSKWKQFFNTRSVLKNILFKHNFLCNGK
ncbi:T-cell-specific guanine nucleotide triphosphate-binding protein 2-like [Mya arenaria]|uniref:T-cell-specific guanine nucleotide triphosphate-binding protein 2-like n=1 Tax=Mya arenaria TaxID=6604 RepID=UPI0022E29B0B|nr:T-cell-specific guanine nucleotide triphosphate-binding protein 2-like [Mya arenaria]